MPPPRRSEENYRRPEDGAFSPPRIGDETFSANLASRRKPSQDTAGRRSEDREREFVRRPSAAASISTTSEGTAMPQAQSTTAGSGMIIPNKSTMEEEYIEVPYGREQRESNATIDTPNTESMRDNPLNDDSASEYQGGLMSPRSPPGGLSALSSRLRDVQDEDENDQAMGGNKSGDDYYDKFGRASVSSDRSMNNPTGHHRGASRASIADEQEKLRRDYEYKIATMQNQIASLQREVADSSQAVAKWKEAEARVQQLEDELDNLQHVRLHLVIVITALFRTFLFSNEIKQTRRSRAFKRNWTNFKRFGSEIRTERHVVSRMTKTSFRSYVIDVRNLRQREQCLKARWVNSHSLPSLALNCLLQGDKELIEQLRTDMEGLFVELENLNRRNDELMTAKDSDLAVIRDLDQQLKDYKKKYELAKTELRSLKGNSLRFAMMDDEAKVSLFEATSQIFLPTPKFEKSDDLLPMSPDGGILDIHITAFLSAIDSLLTAGRSNAPTRVLTPMKTVVNAVTNILDDVRAFERRRPDFDQETLRSLRERAEVTLSNLVAATRTHATSSGLSPVSLLDAAASHVSVSITELGKLICLRKATKAEQEQFPYNPPSSAVSLSGFGSPSPLRYEQGSGSMSSNPRRISQGSATSSMRGRFVDSPSSPPSRAPMDQRRRPPSQNSSSEQTNSPPPLFDRQRTMGGAISDDSSPPEGEDAWAELKV